MKVRVTNLERTLIDATVRPSYARGTEAVLKAYGLAQTTVSVPKLVNILEKIDNVYPYHQAIGFYMARAGYDQRQLSALKALGLHWDFYLGHGLRNTVYDSTWRIYHPAAL